MSSFGSLEIARSGLYASQRALDIVAKNIANANTTGYTRQRLVTTPAAHNLGVEVTTVEQIRDDYIDKQYRSEMGSLGEWQVKTDALTTMEDLIQEPSDYGLNEALSDFFSSLQEMAKQPETKEMRSQVLQNAMVVTDNLHYLYQKLTELQDNQNAEVKSTVTQINEYATNIKDLNEQIRRAEVTGQTANELRDQRNNIIDQLSGMININSTTNSDGTVSIMVGDTYLVDKSDVNLLTVTADKTNPIEGEQSLYSITWQNSGESVDITSGKLKGYMDIRDGTGVTDDDTTKYMGIPYFMDKLNMLAKSVVKTINDIHKTGYNMPNESNGNVSQTGLNFFVPADAENDVTAKNISVSQEIMNNVYNIATSDELIVSNNKGNNKIISQLADLSNKTDITLSIGGESFNIGSFSGFTKEIATELAVVSSKSNNRLESEQIIAQNIENKRYSVSGVSVDEEMTNLIQYQHAYSAAARVMSAIDKNLEVLINSLG